MRYVGCDVGTGNIAVTEKTSNKYKKLKIKDAFFKVNADGFMEGGAAGFGEAMLKQSGSMFVKIDGKLYILGDDAFKWAYMVNQDTLRPMAHGVLNPRESVAMAMVKELIRGVAGEGKEDDVLYYCVPANPLDAEFDIVFHQATLKGIFSELGYKKVYRMTEGLAVVYSELADRKFTGIGISCGAGMINVAYSFLGMPVLAFSLTRAGDWIDQSVAKSTNKTANFVQDTKEKGIDLLDPQNSVERAILTYYDALMEYILAQFGELYENSDPKKLPNITEPVPVVVAGGTAMVQGFADRLGELIKEGFPVPVSSVQLAKDPLFAVSRGLCNAAETTAKQE